MDNLLFACFAGRLGGGFVGVMIGQACAWADVGLCPRVGANEAPCVWRRLHPLMGMGDAARWARRFACVMGSGVWIARVFRGAAGWAAGRGFSVCAAKRA